MIDPTITDSFESEILNLIDNRDNYTRSDLQGIVAALVQKIMTQGHEILKSQDKDK